MKLAEKVESIGKIVAEATDFIGSEDFRRQWFHAEWTQHDRKDVKFVALQKETNSE